MTENEGTTPESQAAGAAPQPTPTPTPTPAAPSAAVPPVPPVPPAPRAPQTPPYVAPDATAPTVPYRPAAPNGAPGYPSGAAFGAGAQPHATHPGSNHPGAAHPASTHPGGTGEKKRSSAGRVVGLLVAAALVGGAAGVGGTYAGLSLWGGQQQTTAAGPSVVTVNDPSSVNATTAVATKVLPSVVTISATSGSSGGTGSGVILSADGYIVTNTHVVTLDGATGDASIRVTTSDGKVYKADVVGTDPTYDLAVIKLQGASGLTPIEWGDSSKLNVGDDTIAIGAPLGLSNTVTTGIVSALDRSIEIASSAAPDTDTQDPNGNGGQDQQPFQFDFGQGQQQSQTSTTIKIAVIQTDAAINPGNSGGALVDDKGKLIGINVAIASSGGSSSGGQAGNIGVGFSIPSDVAKRVSQEIIDNGHATHGLLGASVQSATSVQGATTTGAYIQSVTDGGAAAAAGLRQGDIITAVNGQQVSNAVDATAQVRAAAGGSKATITYIRDGQTRTVDVTLGTMPQS